MLPGVIAATPFLRRRQSLRLPAATLFRERACRAYACASHVCHAPRRLLRHAIRSVDSQSALRAPFVEKRLLALMPAEQARWRSGAILFAMIR